MGYLPWLTALIIALSFLAVFITEHEPALVFAAGFVLLVLAGCLPVELAFTGLSNPGVITLFCLFIIAGAIHSTGALNSLTRHILRNDKTQNTTLIRLLPPVSLISAFFNNTPIVAALTPNILAWCERHKISSSKILLPLSYAAILGGTCTLIGTSTNLIIKGLLEEEFPHIQLGLFEIAWVGLPITLIGILYLYFFSVKVLPDRVKATQSFKQTREYTFELLVEKEVSGLSVEAAGLRGLGDAYLIEVVRQFIRIGNISPDFILQENDRLIFSGSLSIVNELESMSGLRLANEQVYKLDSTIDSQLLEVVVTNISSLNGQSVKQSNFRKRNQAVIIAVVRNGQRLTDRIGDLVIRSGDLLLLQASQAFINRHKYSREYLILQGGNSRPSKRHHLRPIAWAALALVVGLATFNIIPIVAAALLGTLLVVSTGAVTFAEAKASIDFRVLSLIVFAFGFGAAIEYTGLSKWFAQHLSANASSPMVLLMAVYVLTLVLTELVTNNAAAVIAFSLIVDLVSQLNLNIVPYAIVIMIAASASFITPMGYQTNLIVYSAGNYKFSDYLKLGLPLSVIVMLMTLMITPLVWSLRL